MEQPSVTVVSIGTPLNPISAPHKLLTADDLHFCPTLTTPIYLLLPSIAPSSLSPFLARGIQTAANLLPPEKLTLLFCSPLAYNYVRAYEALFRASSVSSHVARSLISGLYARPVWRGRVSTPANSLPGLVLSHASAPAFTSDSPRLVAMGSSPPLTYTLAARPGYTLCMSRPHPQTGTFLTGAHAARTTLLLRFRDEHVFVYPAGSGWQALLIPPLRVLHDPVALRRRLLRTTPRIPVRRPLVRLPRPFGSSPLGFTAAVDIVARRAPGAPTGADLAALDLRILACRHRPNLKRARFERLHSRTAQKQPRSVPSTQPPLLKRRRVRTYASLSSASVTAALAPLASRPRFYNPTAGPALGSNSDTPNQSFKDLASVLSDTLDSGHLPNVMKAEAEREPHNHAHGVEFCDGAAADDCIASFERIVSKSPLEFHEASISAGGVAKIQRGLESIRKPSNKGKSEATARPSDDKDAYQEIVGLAKNGRLTSRMKKELLELLT